MKKLLTIILLSTVMYSCADPKEINGKTYRPYGFINEESCKNDSIHYEISGEACISGVVFAELAFIPTIYTFGFNLWEPVCAKKDLKNTATKGVIK